MRYIISLFLLLQVAEGGIITDNLKLRMQSGEEYIKAMVIMKDRAEIGKLGQGKYKEKANLLRKVAKESQSRIVSFLESHKDRVKSFRSYWVSNALYVYATPDIIREIASFPEVYMVKEVSVWHILGGPGKSMLKPQVKDKAVEWNIDKIKADSVWAYYGYSGQGVNVGILDSGIDPSHPALSGNFSGHFHDAVNGNSDPYDDHGHGTHVAGTIAGGDGPGSFSDDIGVAYNAILSSCKAFDSGGSGSDTSILDCSEWFVSLKADSGVDIRVISNSWGGEHGQTWMWDDIWNNWRGMDIIPVFAAGNSGPGAETVCSPGDYPIVIGVGATDINDNIADFSSRGPAPDTGRYADTTYWSRPDWNFIKPDISAPGAGIRSSVPGGGYETWDGTSMATPHVSGVIALMLEKNPSLDYETVYDILTNYAVDRPGSITYPNNDYGWGRINALLAVENTPSPDEPFIRKTDILVDDISGNNDGIADPGEQVNLYVFLRNYGVNLGNVSATLQVLPEYASEVNITDNTSFYGTIYQDSTEQGDGFAFSVDTTWRAGLSAEFELTITGDGGYVKYDTFTLQIGTPKYYTWYSYNFSTDGGWQTNGSWALTTTAYHSAPSSFTDSPGGEYTNDTHNYLIVGEPFDLSDAYFARIVLWHKYNFEKGYDFGYIQVSTDSSDGSAWMTIASYTDSISDWVCDTVDIPSDFMGQDVYIRFLVESDGSVTRDGWYVDDVKFEQDVPLEGVRVTNMGVTVLDSMGNLNNSLDPGETATLIWKLKNIGTDTANNVVGHLFCDFQGITITDDTANVGSMEPDSIKSLVFEMQADSDVPHGTQVPVYLFIDGDNVTDTFEVTLQVGEVFWTSGDTLYIALDNSDSVYTTLAPQYESIDISGNGTSITFGDDDRMEIDLPFTFKFYGVEYNSVWLSSNGWMAFGADPGTNGYSNDPIPDQDAPNAVIAPLWDDLNPSNGGSIYYLGDTVNHRFIVQFRGVPFYGSSSEFASFTVILYDPAFYITPTGDGDIVVLYDGTPGQSDYTVGIEDATGTSGLQYYCNDTYSEGAALIDSARAVLFTTKSLSGIKEEQPAKIEFSASILYGRGFLPVLKLALPSDMNVKVAFYDVSGRRIGSPYVYKLSRGIHTVSLDANRLRKGVYFVTVDAGKYRLVKKFVNLK